jgi:dTDP-4-amino-4,6-dideoxygalactose transaminase
MEVKFVDLGRQYNLHQVEIDKAIGKVIDNTAFIGGEEVEKFEENFADKIGVKHCISVANGTDAIYITLKMLDIGEGDEVITVANSWISTSETITQTGARPVFVDIEPDFYNINTDLIEEKVTERTKAILPVHLYGQPANLQKIKEVAKKYDLFVIEDSAQAHFAKYQDKILGTFGIAGTFSFYPGKNLGAFGDGGAIVTSNDELAEKVRMFSNHGALQKHHHKMEGINSRLDGIQAAVLNVKLKYIEQWNRERYENALFYNKLLKNIPEVTIPKIRKDSTHIFHLYVIRAQKRDQLKQYLSKEGVSTSIHYPTPLPFLEAYDYLAHKPRDFPIAFEYQSQILSLPMFPELKKNEIEYVVNYIREFYSS